MPTYQRVIVSVEGVGSVIRSARIEDRFKPRVNEMPGRTERWEWRKVRTFGKYRDVTDVDMITGKNTIVHCLAMSTLLVTPRMQVLGRFRGGVLIQVYIDINTRINREIN